MNYLTEDIQTNIICLAMRDYPGCNLSFFIKASLILQILSLSYELLQLIYFLNCPQILRIIKKNSRINNIIYSCFKKIFNPYIFRRRFLSDFISSSSRPIHQILPVSYWQYHNTSFQDKDSLH